MFIVDAHLDLAYNAQRGRAIRKPAVEQTPSHNEIPTVGLPDLRAGHVGLICATIFALPKTGRTMSGPGYTTFDEARAIAQSQLQFYRELEAEKELSIVTQASQLPAASFDMRNPAFGIPAILLMECADPIRSPEEVAEWWTAGVRIVGLAWRKSRYAGGTNYPGKLTVEGRAIATALDAAGMIHDASHLADESFWELLDLCGGPVMASHSNCRAIAPSDRQMSDAMIKATIARGGVIGINFYDEFLLPPGDFKRRKAGFNDLLAHIRHVCDLASSAGHVAIGTDMDGGVGREDIPHELTTAADLPKIGDALASAGFSDADVRNILCENWLRFFGRTLPG